MGRGVVLAVVVTFIACTGSSPSSEPTITPNGGSTPPSTADATTPASSACPADFVMCQDARYYVARTGPSCEMPACEVASGCNEIGIACPGGAPGGAMQNADCGRPCPAMSCEVLADVARKRVEDAIEADRSCSEDADCVSVAVSADCFDACSRATAKSAVATVEQRKREANLKECVPFKAQGCRFDVPPCVPPTPPKCVDKLCQ